MLVPNTAISAAILEIEHMGQMAIENLKESMDALCDKKEEKIPTVYRREKYINFLNKKITDYLVKVNELDLPLEDKKILGGLFHVVNDIERIGDHAENFADSAQDCIQNSLDVSDKGRTQLRDMKMCIRDRLYVV